MSPVPPDVVKSLAPTGTLRAAINLGNSVLAQKDPAGGPPQGVTVDLARSLKQATLVRAESGVDAFMADTLEAAAGVKQPIMEFARTHPGVRVIDGRFVEIRQAMGTPKGRDAAAAYLRAFVEEMKA